MKRILVVDDDEQTRELLRTRLSDSYEVLDTGDPEQALSLAVQYRPDVILLDLMMPRLSGIEVCRNLQAITYTARIPIFIITGESATRYQELCRQLGASGFFTKPLDFSKLQWCLATQFQRDLSERRRYTRVRLSLTLVLRSVNSDGSPFEECSSTENVSPGGLLANCITPFRHGSDVEVYVVHNGQRRFVGLARVVRIEPSGTPWHKCALQLHEPLPTWFL